MSLKKNIILSFLISSVIIAILAVASYVNFIEIRKEIRYLELSDTVRSKSLQLRRHEKNYFLYMDAEEIRGVYIYLKELRDIIREGSPIDSRGKLQELKSIIGEYEQRFNRIENYIAEFHKEFNSLRPYRPPNAIFSPLIESTFLERPMVNARLLEKLFSLPVDAPIIRHLRELNDEIGALRKNGENILAVSKELDKSAREKVEHAIGVLQLATLVLLPLFFIVGLVTLFLNSHSVVRRLRILTDAVRKTGKGNFSSLAVPEKRDEVGVLITAFNAMERDLVLREEELKNKNEELLQSRKLASLGTLASGVAHELNNPLNNIYISAQILEKEARDTCSPQVKEIMEDIVSQTIRVKRIVGDLLEFARGREPRIAEVGLNDLLRRAYKLVCVTAATEGINFSLDVDPENLAVNADPEQLERVFINLFSNAVDAMSGRGDLKVDARSHEDVSIIKVSDSGNGMSAEAVEKIFEPFYTTKDKGTGLGLAIVFNIITRHGGDIKVESREGRGTSFTITLPSGRITHES
ncbi:MAG: ATP-binding protein [Candidatus Sulfobium sp.]|jgi:two-component system NtrC family sensor kinase